MKKKLLFCTFFISLVLLGQNQKKVSIPKEPPYVISKRAADKAFQNGEYTKAEQLYRYCLNLIYVENPEEIRQKIKISKELAQKKQIALNLFVNEKYAEASKYYNEILNLNPSDPSAKKGGKLCNIPTNSSKQIDLILTYVNSLPPSKAIPYLEGINKETPNPTIQRAIETIKSKTSKEPLPVIPPHPSISPPDEKYILGEKLIRQLEECNFNGVISTAKQLLKISPNNAFALRYIATVEDIQKRLDEIERLSSDTGQDERIQNSFNYIFQRRPNCVRERYFLYLFDKGSRLQERLLCKEARPYLLRAKEVYPLLAKQNKVDELLAKGIVLCGGDNPCKENAKKVQDYISEAQILYLQCKYQEALNKYELAKNYDCNADTKKLISDWMSVENDIKKNISLIELFNENLRKADNLLIIDKNCNEAIKLYKEANEIQVKCGSLIKIDINGKIKKAEECLKEQCLKGNLEKASKSRSEKYNLDAIKFYCAAIECADTLTQKIIKDKICETIKLLDGREQLSLNSNPNLVCVTCPDTIIEEIRCDSCLLVKPELIGFGYMYKYFSSDPINYRALSGGIRLKVMSFYNKIPVDFAVGVLYSDNDIKSSNEEITIKQLSVPVSIFLHFPKAKLGKINPYIYGEYQPSFPIGFKYVSGNNTLTGRKNLNSMNNAFTYGIGVSQQWRKLGYSLELFDEYMQNMLSTNIQTTSIPNGNLKRHSYGIRLALRFW